ncbi:MAG: FMN-binding protein [Clostridia bacterium]|nr:FMN-binding protein [Clostridia bacterium]
MFVGLTSADEVSAVDSISGATVTSGAIKGAILDCMTQAGII